MEFWVKHGVHNDIRKNNMKALPKDDWSFVFSPYAVPFPGCEACGGEDMSRNKRVELFLRMLELPKRTKLMILEKIFLTR